MQFLRKRPFFIKDAMVERHTATISHERRLPALWLSGHASRRSCQLPRNSIDLRVSLR